VGAAAIEPGAPYDWISGGEALIPSFIVGLLVEMAVEHDVLIVRFWLEFVANKRIHTFWVKYLFFETLNIQLLNVRVYHVHSFLD